MTDPTPVAMEVWLQAAIASAKCLTGEPHQAAAAVIATALAGERAAGIREGLEMAAKVLEEYALHDLEGAGMCRSGNAGQTLRRFAQRRHTDAVAIRALKAE